MSDTRVLAVAQQKGGAGKTTMAIQLATCWRAEGRSVALVDTDPQASLTGWMRLREHEARAPAEIRFAMVGGWRLGMELDRLRGQVELVIVDTPPHAETEAKLAVRTADLVLVPVQPSPLDIWASRTTLETAAREARQAAVVLTRVPPRGRSLDEAQAALAKDGHPALSARLGNRQAFVASLGRGLGVVESEPRSAAAHEVRALAAESWGELG